MFKNYFLVVALLFSVVLLAQVKVAELPIKYDSDFYNNKESLVISNEATNELVVLVEGNKKTSVYLLDSDFKTISTLELESLPKSFKLFLGYSFTGDEYSVFFSNTNKTKYGVLKVNFKTKSIINKKIDFKLTGEKYVQSISFKNKYYLVSISSKPSELHFYEFTDKFSEDKKNSIDLSFIDYKGNGYTLSARKMMVGKEFGSAKKNSLARIDESTPSSIEVASNKNKLYIVNDKFVFTFDQDKVKTKIVIVNPEDFAVEKITFDKPIIDDDFSNHNSYLYSDKLFQIKCNPSLMKFTIKDFSSKKLLKEITLNKKDSITFKNTPVLQEKTGGLYAGNREFEKTSKFLRKISQGDIGIAIYKSEKDIYEITLGSKKEMTGGGGAAMMPGFGAIPLASIGAMSTAFNPTMFAYNSYSTTKSIRIECLFDNDFNHVKGKPENNLFDNIQAFEDRFYENGIDVSTSSNFFNNNVWFTDSYSFEKGSDVKLKNVFKYDGKMYFSFLGSKDKNYHIIEF